MEVFFRHEQIRNAQKMLIRDALNAMHKNMHLLAHAPTGLGKTDAVLGSAITAAKELGYDVFFITPKNSQHYMAHQTVQGIAQKYGLKINSADIVGKKHLCNARHLKRLPHEDFYQACKNRVRNGMCMHYINALKRKFKLPKTFNYSHLELMEIGLMQNACSYELALGAMAKSKIVICDYAHALIPSISIPLLKKSNKSLENSILIIDEAHNLSLRLRDQLSASLSGWLIRRARKECKSFAADDLQFINEEFEDWVKSLLEGSNEAEIDKDTLKIIIERECEINELINKLREIGSEWIERTQKPSACIRIANFLEFWESETEEEKFIRIAKKQKHGYCIQKRCLSPDIITKQINNAASAILMSGTMKPMKMHRDVLGLDINRTILKEYENPFPKQNRLVLVDRSVTTKYSKRCRKEYEKIAKRIEEYAHSTPGNIAAFFPSYEVMNNVAKYINIEERKIIVQKQEDGAEQVGSVKEQLSARGDCILFGVQGGSLSEGVDYEKNCIKCVLVIGVPLEELTLEVKARIEYYQKKFGRGWEYGYIGPALIRSVQAAGRAVRSENDVAVIAYLDERFGTRAYDIGEYAISDGMHVQAFWNYHLCKQLS